MEARLDGPDRPADPFGHTFQGQIGPVVEHDRDPLVVVEGCHRPEDLVAIEDRPERIANDARCCGVVDLHEPDLAATAEAIAADVDKNPVEPRLEAGRVAQRRGGSPRPEQSILRRVLCLVLVAEEQPGQTLGSVELPVSETEESLHGIRATPAVQGSLPKAMWTLLANIVSIQTFPATKPFSRNRAAAGRLN